MRLLGFFLLTFALTGAAWLPSAALAAPPTTGFFGVGGPVFLLGVFAPALVVLALTAQAEGRAVGAAASARVGPARHGYRHGTRERTLTTSLRPTTFAMPRARVRTPAGTTAEWRGEKVM